MRVRALRLWIVLGAGFLIAGCGPFSPEVPFPDDRGEVAIGIRTRGSSLNSLGSLDVEIHSVFASEDELLAVAHAVREAVAPTDGAVVVDWSGVGGDRTWLEATLDSAWAPSLQTSIDVPAVARAVEGVGFDLGYLHWCGPYEYEVRDTSPQTPLTDPEFRCALWSGETAFVATTVTLQSERPSLAPSLVILVMGLVAAVWAIAELGTAVVRRRRVRWLMVGGGISAWFAINALYGFFLLPTVPKAQTVVSLEPVASGLGRVVDVLTPLLVWSSFYLGMAAIALALVAATISAIFGGGRRSPTPHPRSTPIPPWRT